MYKQLLTLILLLALLPSCTRSADSTKPVQDVVNRYTKLLAEGYAKMDMTGLGEVASPEQVATVKSHMEGLRKAHVRMISTLKNVEFTETSFDGPAQATVKTKETWVFSHREIESGKPMLEMDGFPYEITYALKKDGDRWIIASVTKKARVAGKATSPADAVHKKASSARAKGFKH